MGVERQETVKLPRWAGLAVTSLLFVCCYGLALASILIDSHSIFTQAFGVVIGIQSVLTLFGMWELISRLEALSKQRHDS